MFGLLHKNEIYNSYLTTVTVATLHLTEGFQLFKSTCYHCRVKKRNWKICWIRNIDTTQWCGRRWCSLCCPSHTTTGATCALTNLILNGA